MVHTVTPTQRDPAIGKTLYLWAAALAVTWLSGIEPTWHRLSDSLDGFRSSNQHSQEIERRAQAQQIGLASLLNQVGRVEQFKRNYVTPGKRDEERKALGNKVREQLKNLEADAGAKPGSECETVLKQAEEKIRSLKADAKREKLMPPTQNLANFCADERLWQDFQTSGELKDQKLRTFTDELDLKRKEQATLREEMTKKKSGSDVDFEMLGVKFKAPPLLAPALWCLFAVGWLHAARQTVGAPRIEPDQPAQDISNALPSNISAVVLIAVMTFAVQVRVSWIGLALAQYEGGLSWRALVVVVLLAASGCAAFFLVRIILARHFAGTPAASWTGTGAWLAACMCALLLYAPALAPGAVLRLAHRADQQLLLTSIWTGLAAAVWLWTKRSAGKKGSTAARRLVVGVAGALIIWSVRAGPNRGAQRLAAPYPGKAERLAKRHLKHERYQERLYARSGELRSLNPGFYERFYKNSARQCAPATIIHYVGHHGRFPPSIRLPKADRMTLVKKLPTYEWLGSKTATALVSWASGSRVAIAHERWRQQERSEFGERRVSHKTTSWSYENAALDVLEFHGLGPANIRYAVELLLCGIRQEAAYRIGQQHLRKQARASYRLYDLAAGLAVRYHQPHVIDELVLRIKLAQLELTFLDRTRKWAEFKGKWHRRWLDRKRPVVWHTSTRRIVF